MVVLPLLGALTQYRSVLSAVHVTDADRLSPDSSRTRRWMGSSVAQRIEPWSQNATARPSAPSAMTGSSMRARPLRR